MYGINMKIQGKFKLFLVFGQLQLKIYIYDKEENINLVV